MKEFKENSVSKKYAHVYIVSSERWLSDETDCEWYSNKEYKEGDSFIDSEGLRWYVIAVIR